MSEIQMLVPKRFATTSILLPAEADASRLKMSAFISDCFLSDPDGLRLTWGGGWDASLRVIQSHEQAIRVSGLSSVEIQLQSDDRARDVRVAGLAEGSIVTKDQADRVTVHREDTDRDGVATVASGGGNDLVAIHRSSWDYARDGSGNGRGALSEVWLEEGDDRLLVTFGSVVARGGSGDDSIRSSAWDDELYGDDKGSGPWLTPGHDTIRAGAGDDTLVGDVWMQFEPQREPFGDDLLLGEAGNDGIFGDLIFGYSHFYGADTLVGGAGNDTLWGDAPQSHKWGTAKFGKDVFEFRPGHGMDVIEDFDRLDVVRLLGFGRRLDTFKEVMAVTHDTPDGALIKTGGASSVLLLGWARADLSPNDFLFTA
jgi:Ca2+-binding RTX toxin-like protein